MTQVVVPSPAQAVLDRIPPAMRGERSGALILAMFSTYSYTSGGERFRPRARPLATLPPPLSEPVMFQQPAFICVNLRFPVM